MNSVNDRTLRKRPTVKTSHKLALGLGDFGYSIVSCTIATYVSVFGRMAIGVPAALMGIAVAIGTVFDAISDPIVGYLSDNSKSQFWGKRHLFILLGLIGMTVTSVFIWTVPQDISPTWQFVWFAVGLTLLRTFNTLYYTPVGAFSVEISNDYNERTNIQSLRSVFYIVGMILPIVIMGSFQNRYAERDAAGVITKSGQFFAQGYIDFSYVACAVCMVTTVILFVMTYSHVPRMNQKHKEEFKHEDKKSLKRVILDFFGVLKNKDMRYIIFGYAISMISATLIIAIGFDVFTFTFTLTTTQMYILMGGLLFMTIAGQPLWMKLSKKFDKKKSLIIGLLLSLIACGLIFLMFLARDFFNDIAAKGTLYVAVMLPPLMLAGMGTGVLYSMPLALIGDVVVKNKAQGGAEQTGTYAGMMTFAYKVSQALTQLISGFLLTAVGYVSGSSVQSDGTSKGIGWILCIGLIVSVVAGILIFSKLKIDKKEITRLLNEEAEKTGI